MCYWLLGGINKIEVDGCTWLPKGLVGLGGNSSYRGDWRSFDINNKSGYSEKSVKPEKSSEPQTYTLSKTGSVHAGQLDMAKM